MHSRFSGLADKGKLCDGVHPAQAHSFIQPPEHLSHMERHALGCMQAGDINQRRNKSACPAPLRW
jgi:hypothetical protein